jgi:hypothetical protein
MFQYGKTMKLTQKINTINDESEEEKKEICVRPEKPQSTSDEAIFTIPNRSLGPNELSSSESNQRSPLLERRSPVRLVNSSPSEMMMHNQQNIELITTIISVIQKP